MSASSVGRWVESVTALAAAESLLLAAGDAAEARCERVQAARFYESAAAVSVAAGELNRLVVIAVFTPVMDRAS